MEVYFQRTKERKNIIFEGKVSELLKKLSINSENVIVIKDNTVLTLEDTILKEDKLVIIPVISGG